MVDPNHLIVSGGLRPDNVAQAIARLRPFGVDVASGVESAPGRKDPHKLRDFVANARRAAAALDDGPGDDPGPATGRRRPRRPGGPYDWMDG